MNQKSRQLLDQLENAPVVIWGARMTGLGLVRLCRTNGIQVIGFIDSDPAFIGKLISGVTCHPPAHLRHLASNYPGLKVVVAASTKGREIILQLIDEGFPPNAYIDYAEYCDLFYTVDVMGTCNLKCLSCPHGAEPEDIQRGQMSLNTFKQVIDKIVAENEIVTHISLYSWGEPLLHPSLPEMVEYLHRKGIAAALSSNLSIKNEPLLHKVMQQDPEYLKVSLSGYYHDAYNATHQGGDIYLVRSNLVRLRHYINRHKLNTVVDVNYHMYRSNNRINVQKMQELCDELDFSLSKTYALIMPLERVISKLEGLPSSSTLALENDLLVTVEEGIEAANRNSNSNQPCPFLENQTIINWDLSVPVCCTTFNRGANIVASNFLVSPHSEILTQKRQASICRTCTKHGLPNYNLGLNPGAWAKFASEKTSLDRQ